MNLLASYEVVYGMIKVFELLMKGLILVFVLFAVPIAAQEFDPYQRLHDPRAITRLDGIDSEPIRIYSGVGWPKRPRSEYDGHHILASDTGAGVITHIWAQLYNQIDSLTSIRIWIDDSLILTSHLYSFFTKPNGVFRPPLDSIVSGANVCDVQLPYKKSFLVTYYADWDVCCLFWGIEYRRIADTASLESFRLPPSAEYIDAQTKAEQAMHLVERWGTAGTEKLTIDEELPSHDTLVLAEIEGEGMIQRLHIVPGTIDTALLKSVTLLMCWDGSPHASVRVPLADFFGCGGGMQDINSLDIRATKSGEFTSLFAMPFYRKAKIVLVNTANVTIPIRSEVTYSLESIDRTKTGYFTAIYNESLPAKYSVYHPVGRVFGRGKLVGLQAAFPDDTAPYFLEGDPIISIDSASEYSIRYTGLEDYFNGGWFFDDGSYSLPLAGCPERWTSAYRFHYLDAYDYHKSFDMKIQHGVHNDYQCSYRTVAYLYRQWTPFWTSHDTIRAGETWRIGGTGYAPNEQITAQINGQDLFTLTTNIRGEFSYDVTVPASLQQGVHQLSVAGISKPESIVVLPQPSVYFIRDSLPVLARYGEPIEIKGNGFARDDSVHLYIDTVKIGVTAVDATYRFHFIGRVPWLPDGQYRVVARSSSGEQSQSDSTLPVTRTLQYEFEDLFPVVWSDAYAFAVYLGYLADTSFSRHNSAGFRPDTSGKAMMMKFVVPVSDTFDLSLYVAKGRQYGIYEVYIDSTLVETFDGWYDTSYYFEVRRSPKLIGKTMYLAKGAHYIEFRCVGAHEGNIEYLLDADNLILTPVTEFHELPPDSIESTVIEASLPQEIVYVNVFPNPLKDGQRMHVSIDFGSDVTLHRDRLRLSLLDMKGNTVVELFSGTISDNTHVDEYLLPHNVSSGTYVLNVLIESASQQRRSIVTRKVLVE